MSSKRVSRKKLQSLGFCQRPILALTGFNWLGLIMILAGIATALFWTSISGVIISVLGLLSVILHYFKFKISGQRFIKNLGPAAEDERTFYALRSLRYEKLKGQRQHQRSIRLNDQWRLIVEIQKEASEAVVKIVKIEDYH